jgi:hypothetical protein
VVTKVVVVVTYITVTLGELLLLPPPPGVLVGDETDGNDVMLGMLVT